MSGFACGSPSRAKARTHGSRNNPIPLNLAMKGSASPAAAQLQQALQGLNAAIQPALKGVRVIGPNANQFCQQELAGISRWSGLERFVCEKGADPSAHSLTHSRQCLAAVHSNKATRFVAART